MVAAARSPAHARHAELCRRAQAGDRAALGELAAAVLPWCRRKSGKYGRSFRVDRDDLCQAGMMRLAAAVRGFRPELGFTFLNWFARCAARRMLLDARTEAARRDREGAPRDAIEPAAPAPEFDPGRVGPALAALDPVVRAIVEHVHGVGGRKRVPVEEAAERAGVPACWAGMFLAEGEARLRRLVG